MKLPQGLQQTQMENTWAAVLEPVINQPLIQGILLEDITLTTGANVVNHRLGRKLRGWIITRRNSAATIYDTQVANQMPQLTLQLTASAGCVVSIWCF